VTRPTAGRVLLFGQEAALRSPAESIRHKMALITEDRKFTGLNLIDSVEHNISMVRLPWFSKMGVIDPRQEAAAAEKQIKALTIRVMSRNSITASLSGGNQQKVVLAKWLLTEPDIIILDEPTRGIDVGAKREIYLLIGEIARAGKAVLMISSEIPEIMGLSDRILVLAEGQLTGELQRAEFSQENIMRLASRLKTVAL